MASSGLLGFRGILMDAPVPGRVRVMRDGALLISDGKIAATGAHDTLRRAPCAEGARWLDYSQRLILPGLIDLHTHLPQYPAVARGQADLLTWLRQSVFPLEREFSGPKCQAEPAMFFKELARHGTTTAAIYAAIYEDSCDAAFEAAKESGLRVILGKMMMDVGSYGAQQPRKVVSISLLESERLCKKWHRANHGLLDYAFSPRFAVSCSEKLMRSVSELAAQYDAYIQTHLAESTEEIEKVRNLFMWAANYTDVYDKCGLLGPRTLLGHCLHLSPEEIAVIAERGARVAHCPTSNLFLGSGLIKLDQIRRAGILTGLGSDVAAGPELNLWQVMRSAVETQKVRTMYDPTVEKFTPTDAFHLATQGGADVLGKGAVIGSLDPGKEADIVVMDPEVMLPYKKRHRAVPELAPEDLVALCVYRGGPAAVLDTYVRGESVYQSPAPGLFG